MFQDLCQIWQKKIETREPWFGLFPIPGGDGRSFQKLGPVRVQHFRRDEAGGSAAAIGGSALARERQFLAKFRQNVARFRLYRHRFLQENTRFAAFFKIYKIIYLKFLKFGNILQILQRLQIFC